MRTMRSARVSVLSVGLLPFLLLMTNSRCMAATRSTEPMADGQIQQVAWKLAVVFKRQKDRRVYVGTVDPVNHVRLLPLVPHRNPDLKSAGSPASRNEAVADYEIWLAADGQTQGIWYASAQERFGLLPAEKGAGHRDNGVLKNLIKAAALPTPQSRPRPDASSRVSHLPWPPSLQLLCEESPVIVVGRVVGILRNAHTPIAASGADQHTVFVIAVEDYLKNDTTNIHNKTLRDRLSLAPPIVKVWQEGGALSWRNDELSLQGKGYEVKNIPLMTLGDRHILFLQGSSASRDKRVVNGMPRKEPDTEKYIEADEYIASYPTVGNLVLRNGKTRQHFDPDFEGYPFYDGPQIVDVTEKEAIAAIQAECSPKPSKD